ncbi:hypothetical protein LEP1GSC005_3833 [Leptospira santarosai str. ST188]|nr:hypothetical protein LEP1GSC068_3149 [Leptospira sp. Fiocruz LV3954]EMF89875.1 hypothetical protein LEP1GSC005_3833 [Leptospira santarosai str. ST188]EMI68729.1 hypothetical protein LEP1GSC076_2349 [Leptospira sp. Fiocruz LV4135]
MEQSGPGSNKLKSITFIPESGPLFIELKPLLKVSYPIEKKRIN